MKYIILLLLLFPIVCGAEEINIQAIIRIESSGNPNAYNKSSGCIGLMQINPKGALADWNNQTYEECSWAVSYDNKDVRACTKHPIIDKYNIGSLYNPIINIKIGTWYINERIPQMLKAYGIEDTVENRLIAYHDGIGNLRKYLKGERKLGKNMKAYIKKYKRLTK